MAEDQKPPVELVISVSRVRIGIILLALFWLPIWLLAPFFAAETGTTVAHATLVVGTVQVVFGLIGLIILGRQSIMIVRQTSRRQLPKVVWHIFWSGQV
jgi:hypothetical protein